jgi:hypothetical protein
VGAYGAGSHVSLLYEEYLMTASDADDPTLRRGRSPHADPGAGRGALAFVFDLDGTLVDSVWDLLAARRARALGVGLLSGGYGQEELERAGAYRVYQDPADLLRHLDEVGVRMTE